MAIKNNFKMAEAGEDSRSRQIYSASPRARRGFTPPRLGFYSGTFDPVHVGHVEFALAAAKQAGLEKVVFLPENLPREKDVVTSLRYRTSMLKLALKPYSNLELKTLAEDRFTVGGSLPILQSMFAGHKLVFLCGSDAAKTFLYRWEGLDELLATTELVIGLRQNDTKNMVDKVFSQLNKPAKYSVIKAPKPYLASTNIRSGNNTIKDIDPRVAEFIIKNKIYS